MLSDTIANGVHYYSTVTIWAAKIHAMLFSMSVLHVSRTAYTHCSNDCSILFFSFDLFTFFPIWRDARTIHIYVNLLDLIKEEEKDEICCIISHQNALEVNSCRILLWHTTNKIQLIHSIPFLYRVQKNVPHFSLRRGNRDHLVCLSTNFIPSNDLKGMKKCMKNVS